MLLQRMGKAREITTRELLLLIDYVDRLYIALQIIIRNERQDNFVIEG